MANNLKDHLKEVADAIRAKKGTTDLINPQDFATEIEGISGGGSGEGDGSNWRYFSTSDRGILNNLRLSISLIKFSSNGEITILPGGSVDMANNSDYIMAMAFDMNQVIRILAPTGDFITTVGEAVEFSLEMEGLDMSSLGIEITKEEFYALTNA
jgi:hypothetical protein